MLQWSHQISGLISAFLWRPYLSLSQSSKPPWVTSFCKLHYLPSFIKETRHSNGKGKIIVIIIVNNEPWGEGTIMQKCWLEPTCYSKRSWIIVTQGIILRLTIIYVITYFIILFDDFSYSPLLGYRKLCRVSEMGRNDKEDVKPKVL